LQHYSAETVDISKPACFQNHSNSVFRDLEIATPKVAIGGKTARRSPPSARNDNPAI
jgi:hypothetical protein